MKNNYDDIGIKFINDSETLKLFNELNSTVQSKIILDALKRSSRVMKDKIKSNFIAQKKDLSRTNYRDLNKTLKIANRKKKKDHQLGIIIGFTKEGYKYRWIQWGTEDRYTKKKMYRGKIEGNNFFYSGG